MRLFADRLEVWNPGTLPGMLSLESLQGDHPSVPFNPPIAESLYLTRYIEKAGSGTQKMIELCREAGLPEPDFELRQGSFVVTVWKDWLTDAVVKSLDLNERQALAVRAIRQTNRVTNSQYQTRCITLGFLLTEAVLLMYMALSDAHRDFGMSSAFGAIGGVVFFSGALTTPFAVLVGALAKKRGILRCGIFVLVLNTVPAALIIAFGMALGF